MEGVPPVAALHRGGQLDGLRHGEGLPGGEAAAPHAGDQAHIIGDVHPQGVPVPGGHVGEGGQLPPGQGELGGGGAPLGQDGGQVVDGDLGDGALRVRQGEHIGAPLLVHPDAGIHQVVEHIGAPALPVGEGENAHHAPARPLLGQVEAAVDGHEGVVLRLDQVLPVLADHPQLSVQVHRRDAQLEGHHAVVPEGDDHVPAGVHKAPLAVQLTLGQSLAVSPHRGPRRYGGRGGQEQRPRAQRQGQQHRRGAGSSPTSHACPPLSRLSYWNSSHLSMPLYSLRFLSAGRPKVRSNSVWEESTLTRQPGGRAPAAAPKAR